MSHHDDDFNFEPIRGLPEMLPADEHILWQGSPAPFALAREALGLYWIAGYFLLLAVWRVGVSSIDFPMAVALTHAVPFVVIGAVACAILYAVAWVQARATVYTLTNKRVVMRFGASVPKAVNLPLSKIGSADVRPVGGGFVDIVLAPTERFPLGWLQTWPHVRPWKVADPQPMLRAVSDSFVPVLAEALRSADPAGANAGQASSVSGLEAAA